MQQISDLQYHTLIKCESVLNDNHKNADAIITNNLGEISVGLE